MIISRRVVTGDLEVTQGTDATPTPAANSLRCEEPEFAWLDPRTYEPRSVKPSLGREQNSYGGALGQLTFRVVVRGSGVAGTPPECGPFLVACGLGETIVPSTSVTYAPISTGRETISTYYYDDGKLTKLLGSYGNVEFVADVGQPLMANFTFEGHVVDPVDDALPAPNYATVEAPVVLGAAFQVDGFSAKISNWNFGLQNEIAKPGDQSAADGYGDLDITDRNIAGSFDPLDTLIAQYDWVSKWKANTLMALASGQIGGTAGNIINISMPAIQYQEFTDGERERLKSLEVGFGAKEVTGDDEVSIAFT